MDAENRAAHVRSKDSYSLIIKQSSPNHCGGHTGIGFIVVYNQLKLCSVYSTRGVDLIHGKESAFFDIVS